jgi:hypothetical protein
MASDGTALCIVLPPPNLPDERRLKYWLLVGYDVELALDANPGREAAVSAHGPHDCYQLSADLMGSAATLLQPVKSGASKGIDFSWQQIDQQPPVSQRQGVEGFEEDHR